MPRAANISSANIESPAAHSLLSPRMPSGGGTDQEAAHRSTRRCCRLGALIMHWFINCFRSSDTPEPSSRPRPIITDLGNQYQAPIVTPSPRASGSVSSRESEEDHDLAERGTLLPKRRTPEPGTSAAPSGSAAVAAAATTAAAAAAAAVAAASTAAAPDAADAAPSDVPRHRRTGSDSARLHVEGVRARVMTTAAAAAKAKFGTTEAEFNAVAELLGTDADDEDFCPTCLEAYTDDNPKIFTRCGHSFHMQCIYAWLERKNTCPLCESPMDLQDDILL